MPSKVNRCRGLLLGGMGRLQERFLDTSQSLGYALSRNDTLIFAYMLPYYLLLLVSLLAGKTRSRPQFGLNGQDGCWSWHRRWLTPVESLR